MSSRRDEPKQDGVIHGSPSQIKVLRRCERKWAFKYIDRLSEPTTAKQQFGTDGHSHMEAWIKDGVRPPNTETGNAAKQLIRSDYIPEPSPALTDMVERFIEIPLPHIHPKAKIIGYTDLVVPPTLVDPATVIDYKFTSSLRWAMTLEQLRRDPQGVIYGKWAMDEFGVDEARARFLYSVASNPKSGPRQPKGSKKVEAIFTRKDIAEPWAEIEFDMARIVHARLNWKSANTDAKPNPEACDDFGGCPFSGTCQLVRGQRLAILAKKSLLSHSDDNDKVNPQNSKEGPMSLMDKIRNMKSKADAGEDPLKQSAASDAPLLDRLRAKAQAEGVNPPVAEAPAPEPPVDDPNAEALAGLEALSVKELKQYAKSQGVKGFSTMPKPVLVSAILAAVVQDDTSGVVSVEKTQQPAPAEPSTSEPASTGSLADKLKAKTAEAAEGEREIVGGPGMTEDGKIPPHPIQAEHDANSSGCKRPVGLLSGSNMIACDNEGCQWSKIAVEIEGKGGPGKLQAEVTVTVNGAGLMVLFDCAMRKGHSNQVVENLSDWIAAVSAKVAADNEVPHWGLIEYAQGAPALAAALDNALTAKPPSGCILVDSYSLEGRAVKDVLIRHAEIVVQGVR